MSLTIEELTSRLLELERWRDGEQRRLMQAIHDTQADHGRALVRLETAAVNTERELGAIRLEMQAGFGAIMAALDGLQGGASEQ